MTLLKRAVAVTRGAELDDLVMELVEHLEHVLHLLVLLLLLACAGHAGRRRCGAGIATPRRFFQCLRHLLHLPLHLPKPQSLEGILQRLSEPSVCNTHDQSDDCRDEQRVIADVAEGQGAKDATKQERAQDADQDTTLFDVHVNLGALHHGKLPTPTTFPQQDHRRPPDGGADVSGGTCAMRCSHNGPKVHRAHGILQATCASRESDGSVVGPPRLRVAVVGDASDEAEQEENGVPEQGDAIEGLASEAQRVMWNNESAEKRAENKRDDD
mmetsp:Transcript_46208/g.134531  ORF Transcript_46208/g.134531 Transcript_46208/m.134531 type:complete len:270 (-) Transcript_46208:260-1069(-)